MIGAHEIIKNSIALVNERRAFFFSIMLIPAVISFIAGILPILGENSVLVVLTLVLSLVAGIIGVFAGIAVLIGFKEEKLADWKAAYKQSTKWFWSVTWLNILVGVVVLVGTILLIVPGIYLYICFAFSGAFLIMENKRGWDAAQASKELVKGYWWAVLGRFIVIGLYLALAILVFTMAFGFIAVLLGSILGTVVVQLISLVVNIILVPYLSAMMFTMYKNLKKLKK